jgi:hypothetical protein
VIINEEEQHRKIQVHCTYTRSRDWMQHQWNTEFIGQSLYGLPYGMENIRMQSNVVVDLNMIFRDGYSRDAIVQATFAFGINNVEGNKIDIKVKIFFIRKPGQREHSLTSVHRNVYIVRCMTCVHRDAHTDLRLLVDLQRVYICHLHLFHRL